MAVPFRVIDHLNLPVNRVSLMSSVQSTVSLVPMLGARRASGKRPRLTPTHPMKKYLYRWIGLLACSLSPCGFSSLHAQNIEAESSEVDDEEVVLLSPFEVSAEDSSGYTATSTLAGTRVRTDLRDIASPITVVTKQFMDDTASFSNNDLLVYTNNTEVGGLNGNFGLGGQSDESSSLLRPSENTRVRGLDAADNTRNYFLSDIPWDAYNVDRVDIQRGPNSILFGVGSPSGIINAQTIVASMEREQGEVANQIDQFGSVRWTFDYNRPIIKDLLAVRVAGLHSDRNFRQEPAFNKDERIFGTLKFEPQILSEALGGRLQLGASVERGRITANNPRVLPPIDGISLWFDDEAGDGVNDPIGMGKGIYDTFILESGGYGSASRGNNNTVDEFKYIPAYTAIDGGAINNGGVVAFFDPGASAPAFISRQAPRTFVGAIGPDGSVDNTVGGVPFGSILRSASWGAYTVNIDRIDNREGRQSRFPLAERGYYKDASLSDASIFNFYENLIDGNNKREKTDWTNVTFSAAQALFDNRLGLELVYNKQDYSDGQYGLNWGNPVITIDANANLQHQIPQYSTVPDPSSPGDTLIDLGSYQVPGFTPSAEQPYANPWAGSAMAFGSPNNNVINDIEREDIRATAFGEFRAEDVFGDGSRLANFIGRHVFTGLFSTSERLQTQTLFRNAAMDYRWATDRQDLDQLNDGTRSVVPIMYLSQPLLGGNATSASGLNLSRVMTNFNLSGSYEIDYFDPTWKRPTDPNAAGYVDPGADATLWNGDISTQSELPANYVGRVSGPGTILNASAGDFDELVTEYALDYQKVESLGFTWQGHFLDGLLVPTVGWREDTLARKDGRGAKTNGRAAQSAELEKNIDDLTGTTTSWGVVAHMPDSWLDEIPVITGLSGYYNKGRNSQVLVRYNFDGQPLDNPEADSTDYGVVVRALDDRLSVKLGRYETKVANGIGGGLGGSTSNIASYEAWLVGSTLTNYFGRAGLDPSQSWYWNWADIDEGGAIDALKDPSSQAFLNHPSSIQQKAAMDAVISGMDQAFFDAYEIPIDVAALQAAYAADDPSAVAAAVANTFVPTNYITAVGTNSGGRINGVFPDGSIDSVSEGWELEISFKPNRNWDLVVNASKTDAYREKLGQPMLNFIESQKQRFEGPAGDLRQWWGGDADFRERYAENVLAAVDFATDQIGQQVPELRPYRFSLITNHRFTEGMLTGFNLGGAFRWEDEPILFYELKDDLSGLDVSKTLKGPAESSLDIWLGYERKISERLNWRIQANVRNVGESRDLIPISVNPDGSIGVQRISEGMTWSLSNTFSF
jgi:outer membrane receptor protein involved in Fe transport